MPIKLRKEIELEYRAELERILSKKIQNSKELYDNLKLGDHLGEILQSSANDVAKLVVMRSAKKFLNEKSYETISALIKDGTISTYELWKFSISVANTLRPIAGNRFTYLVCSTLNDGFTHRNLPIQATTKGPIRKELASKLMYIDSEKKPRDMKPDIDIVLYLKSNNFPIAIISCKTSLAERVMQTIRWKEHVSQLPNEISSIKIYLVTAWEDFKKNTDRNRVSVLDGVYAANESVIEGDNIKKFSKIYDDLEGTLSGIISDQK